MDNTIAPSLPWSVKDYGPPETPAISTLPPELQLLAAMVNSRAVQNTNNRLSVDDAFERLEELRNHVATKIGPIAKPANIVFTPELPKTRSGKIMRRLLRDVAEKRPLGDTTTLADATVVHEIADRAAADAAEE